MSKTYTFGGLAKNMMIQLGAMALGFMGILVFGFGLGSEALPPEPPYRPYPVPARPPNPLLMGIGGLMMASSAITMFILWVHLYIRKWHGWYFERIVLRYGDRLADFIIFARNPSYPYSEIELAGHDTTFFSAVVPDRFANMRLHWYLLRGVTEDSDDFYIVLGSPVRLSALGQYASETILFRGFFAKVMVRDIAATFFTYVERDTLDVIERRFLMFFKRRETEPRQELIPVAVVHDSDWHGAVIRLAEVGLPAFGNLEQAIGVLNRVAKLASEKVVELHQAEVNTLRSLLDESLNLVQNTSDIQILVRGMRIYEAKGELTPPRKIKWSTILIATLLGVGIVLLILLIFMRWGS